MKTNKFILGLLVIILIPITYVNTYANYDYVCSYKIWTCQDYEDNCWVSEGHKYCQWVRTTHTIIWNTRVGCPGGAQTSEKDSFKDTKQLGLQNVGWFMFWSKSWVWDWNVVNQNSNSQDFSTVGKLAQDFSIDKKNSEQNNTIISWDEEVSCIIDVGEISDKTDLESPEIKIKQESYSWIIFPTPLNNTCYTDQWCISKASSWSILNTPTQNEVWTYNSWLNTESCYRKYKEDNYCTRYINSADTHIWTKVTIKCDDNKSWCQNYYQVRGNDSDVESDNVWKLNDNDTFILVFDWIYDIIVPDKAWNIGIKKIEYKNWTINSLSQSEKNIERIKSVKTKIDLKSSTTLIKHKTNGPVSDFIQCYLADKVSKCDNSDTIEPEGVILFNDKKWTFNEGIYYPENKCVREIKLQAKCISDTAPVLITPSWCNWEIQETQNITSNIEGADIWIIDIVWNLKILKYNINTIDLISPTFSNATPEILRVTWEDENIWSKRTLHFTILEESAIWCYTTNKVKYLVNFSIKPKGSTEKINKTLTWEIDASSSKWIKTKIQHDFDFKQVWEYTIESIILTDSAWNIGTLNPNYLFNVYPWNFDFKNSSLELKGIETTEMGQNDVYANFKDKYTYILTLKDASGNPIYGKKVSELIQDVEDNKKNKNKNKWRSVCYRYFIRRNRINQ